MDEAVAHERVHVDDASFQSDGELVPASLYLPEEAERPRPGILLCPGRLREIAGLEFLCRRLAERGAAVLAIQYRGMDLRTDDRDCRNALDRLGEVPQLDRGRIGLVGHSRGAMASLRVAAQDARVRSVVALQPVADLDQYVRATRDYAPTRYQGLISSLGGPPEDAPETYAALSAIRYADRIRVPVLLVAGTMDLHSPLDHSLWMRDALVGSGNADVRLEVLDGVGHFFEHGYSGYVRETIADLTVDWLGRTLPL